MKKLAIVTVLAVMAMVAAVPAMAHFQTIIPSDDIVAAGESRDITLDIRFMHPFEGPLMEMAKPVQFGVMLRGEKQNLMNTLNVVKKEGATAYSADFQIKRPGDHVFFIEPAPYWEPAEDCFIIHYTKVVVNSMGMEDGWDEEIGLKTEIAPLTRPYGLWAGNVFQGVVKVDGKPVPYAEVEVEFLNDKDGIKAPAAPFVTQVVKADSNGVFTYAMPRAGWWGFAALNEDTKTMKGPDGEQKSIEIGALIWVNVVDMK